MLHTTTLERFDAALAKTIDYGSALAARAPEKRIARAEKELGCKLPAALRTLYAWHDGETEDGTVFDALCHDDLNDKRQFHDPRPFEVRFMSLEEVEKTGAYDAWIDPETKSCWFSKVDGTETACHLVPFLWIAGEDDGGEEEEEDLERGVNDDDWLLAVDDVSGNVWMFEPESQGLEGIAHVASSLDEWMRERTKKLEALAATDAKSTAASKAPATASAAQTLLSLLVEKGAIELAEGAEVPKVAKRLAPLLDQLPRKRAIESATEFFEEDDDIAELFIDDDVLRALVSQFAG